MRYINARRNVDETVLKVDINRGQGLFKIVLSCLSIEERNREFKQRFKDSGARRAFIISLAPGMQENKYLQTFGIGSTQLNLLRRYGLMYLR